MKRFIIFFIYSLLFLPATICYSQSTGKSASSHIIDSLLIVLKRSAEDTNKVNVLNSLSRQHANISNYDKALQYAEQAKQNAEKINFKKGLAHSYLNVGVAYWNQADFDAAEREFRAALKIYENIKNKKGIATCYNNIGLIYWNRGDFDKAIDNILKGMKLWQAINDKPGIAMGYLNIGNIYLNQENLDKALEYYEKSLKISEELGEKQSQATTLNNLGVIYEQKKDIEKALKYHLKALKINEEIGNKSSVGMSYNNIGVIYENQGKHEEALKYQLKSVEINNEIGNPQGAARSYNNIGNIYYQLGKYKTALEYNTKSLELCKKIGFSPGMQDAYFSLSKLAETQNNYKSALEYYKLYTEIKDSIYDEESNKQVTDMNTKYDSEQKDKEIKLLNSEKEAQANLAASEKKRQQIILISVSIVLLLVLVFAFFIYRNSRYKQRLNKELEKLSIVASETDNGVLICGPKGEIEWSNSGLTRLLGYTFEELKKKGNTIEELSSNPDIKKVIHESIAKKKTSTYEVLNITKNGEERWTQSTLTPILNENGSIKKLVVIDTDISDRKKIEAKLNEQNKELEQSHKDILVLSEIGQWITSTLSVEKIVEKTYGNINKLMDADVFCIGIHNKANNSIDFPGFIEKGIKYDSSYDLNDNTRLPVLCFKNRQEILINDLQKDHTQFIPFIPPPIAGEHPESLIYLPLLLNDKIVGVINVESFRKNAYTAYHLNILKNLAVYVAIAIENAKLYENLESKVEERTVELVKRNEEVEKMYHNIQVMSEVGQQLTSTLDIETVFSKLHEHINRLMHAEVFGIRIYHPETETVEVKYEYEKGERMDSMSFTMDNESNFSVWSIKNRKDIFINDNVNEYKKYVDEIVVIDGELTHSLMFCPMILKDKVIGVVTVQSYEKHRYTKQHLDILRTLANYAAIAIENARLYNNIQVLNEIGQEITSTQDLGEVLDTVYAKVNSLMDATEFGFGIFNAENQAIDFSNYYYEGKRMAADLDTWVSMSDDNRLSVWCVKNKKPVFINDMRQEYSNYITNLNSYKGEGKLLLESVMCLPLAIKEKLVGVISVQSPKKNAYTRNQLEILQTLASYIAIALDNAHLYNNMEEEIKSRTKEIEKQKILVEDKNLKITDSINYALRIQQAILPSQQMLSSILPDSFIFFKPKDIVSGDFYWAHAVDQHQILFAAVDCTGHGVPGAFMSIMGYNLLEQIVKEQKIYEPASILNELSKSVVRTLKQTDEIGSVKEGMDIALCKIDYRSFELEYSGAHNSLNIVRQGVLTETKASSRSIGISLANSTPFVNHRLKLEKGDCIYIFSDGFADQKGGPENKKFFYQPFRELLVSIHQQNMAEQGNMLEQVMNNWKKNKDQIDDMLVIGVRI
ncbi:MAG: tetratricopeptide repeat protein [Bacteroidia bacterium]